MKMIRAITEFFRFNNWSVRRELKKLEQDPRLKDVKTPDYLYENILSKIAIYEQAKEEKEALLKELAAIQETIDFVEQPEVHERIQRGIKNRKKRFILVTSMVILIIGCGTVGIAAPGYVRGMIAGFASNSSIVSSGDSSDYVPDYLNTYSESDAYELAKETLGMSILPMPSLPGMFYDSVSISNSLKQILLLYTYNENIITYSSANGNFNSYASSDTLPSTTSQYVLSENNIILVEDYIEHQRISYVYNNIFYSISGKLTTNDIDIIIAEIQHSILY